MNPPKPASFIRKPSDLAPYAAAFCLLSLTQISGAAATLVAGYDFTGATNTNKLEDKVNDFNLTVTTSGAGEVSFGSSGSFS